MQFWSTNHSQTSEQYSKYSKICCPLLQELTYGPVQPYFAIKSFSLKRYRIRGIACERKRTKISTSYQSLAFGPSNFQKMFISLMLSRNSSLNWLKLVPYFHYHNFHFNSTPLKLNNKFLISTPLHFSHYFELNWRLSCILILCP